MLRRITMFALLAFASTFLLPKPGSLYAQIGIRNICPAQDIQQRGPSFVPGGIILTTFDRANLWVYDIDRDRRYPLPETFPCTSNCRLSPDARWVVYFNDLINAFNRMRLTGIERSLVSEYASQVEWWSPNTWLIWTPGRQAYLQMDGSTDREYLDVRAVASVQPGGRWGLLIEPDGDSFRRALVNLTDRGQRLDLGRGMNYFDDYSWSPDGTRLAYAAPVFDDRYNQPAGTELYLVAPGDSAPTQLTRLTDAYGTARINGLRSGELAWSPDGRQIAFWVVDLRGLDPAVDTGSATIHVLDVDSRELRRYCQVTTDVNTPNPPRLSWSPDSTHLAFGADLPGDEKPALLLALDTQTGQFTVLSEGLYPALGAPDVAVWGLPPN